MNDNGSGLSASDVLALDNNRGDFMNGGMGLFGGDNFKARHMIGV